MNDFAALLQRLAAARVNYVLVGGVAAVVHGSARLTQDVDVVYERTDENLARLVDALAPLTPYLRGAPPGLPFRFDVETIRRGLNFTLQTSVGAIDLLGEVAGDGTYARLSAHTVAIELFGTLVRVVDLETLIELKRAAGRPKDFEVIAELEALREESEER